MRHTFSKRQEVLPLPNLSEIQSTSYNWFLNEGVNEILEEINPIEDYTGRGWQLSFSEHRFDKPKYELSEAIHKGLTYDIPWYLTATLEDLNTKRKKSQEVYMGDIPKMTRKGTFIINGIERAVVNQLTRSEGVFFVGETDPSTGQRLAGAKVLPKNGAWLEFETSKAGVITVKIDRRRKITATALLRVFGVISDEELLSTFAGVDTDPQRSFIQATIDKDPAKSYDEAILEVYRKLRPGEPLVLENAKILVEGMFFNSRRYSLGRVGRFKLNQKLGLTFPNEKQYHLLHKEDLIRVISKIIELNNGIGDFDDIDHLGNRRVRSVGELLQQQIRIGFLQMERLIKERMSLQARGELCSPGVLISTRPVAARVHSFFASSQLSQFHDQINPLSGLDHLRRLSVTGPGGLTKERASFSVRDAHYSHYGRICPIRTPEGQSIGLVTYLALYARVNEYGFLETPYRKLIKENEKVKMTDEIVYLAAYDEEEHFITNATVETDDRGYIKQERIPLRHQGNFFVGRVGQADFMDITPQQVVGASAALIPFLANDDVNRALVGTNQQAQAVPLLRPEAPLVGTGLEKEIAQNSGEIIIAEEDGVVTFVDATEIRIKEEGRANEKTYYLEKFLKSNNETCYNQRSLVEVGQKIKKGDLLADGPASDRGEIALGKNLRIAYMEFEGLGYEDAVVISDRLVADDSLSSIIISEHTVQVLETKLGPEEITRDIPNVSEEALRNLDEEGIVYIGANVKSGDILVGKIAPKGESELSAEERLLRSIFGEKAREVRDNSLRVPHGEYGTVVGIKVLDKEDNEELPSGVLKEIHVLVAQIRKIMIGDKLAGRHGNKGVISKIVPVEDMPHTEDGQPIDIIISPASVVSRMNVGQLMETHLGWAADKLEVKYAVPPLEPFEAELLEGELKKAGLAVTGKTRLIDGRTGEYFDQEIVIGNAYILKLMHLAEDKVHARSTGPYSLITQQPLGGKAQFGGQRFGEMEVWALEAYSAAHILKEMLTIKSDDLLGRTSAYRSIIQGEKIPESTIPESFKLLIRELNGLALDMETLEWKEERKKVRGKEEGNEKAKSGSEAKVKEQKSNDKFQSSNVKSTSKSK